MNAPRPLHRSPLCWVGGFLLASLLWAWASSMKVQENLNAGMRPLGIVARSGSGQLTLMLHEMPRPVRYFDLYRVPLKPEPEDAGGWISWFRSPAYEKARYFPYPGTGGVVPLHVFRVPYWSMALVWLGAATALLARRRRRWSARRREILQRALLPLG